MTTLASAARRAPSRVWIPALLAVAAATAWAALAFAHPAATAVPVVVALVIWAAWTAPLHRSAAILAFLVLALDDSENANGLWRSPLAPVGDVLHHSLRTITPAARVPITGTELAILLLFGVAAWRRSRGERAEGHVPSAPALTAVAVAYVAALGFAIANGLARGGSAEVAVWQTRPLLLTAALFFLFEAALRGPLDTLLVGKVLVLAAASKALVAVWVRWAVAPHAAIPVEYVTDHGDSMLFTLGCLVLAAHAFERPDRRRVQAALLFLPLLLLGIDANTRRTAWLQLALGLLVFLVVARGSRRRRTVGRLALAALPILALYGAAGWSSTAAAFRPVQLVRSMVDSKVDRSTWDRQVEDWNLAMSMRDHPLLGRGFGHEWTEYYAGDEITGIFWRYHAQPHNQVLGLLLFSGALAFAGIWAPFAVLVLLAARAYPRARTPEERAAALCVGASSIVFAVQCFSDLGPFWPQYAVLAAIALAMGGKLAAATGALR
jgi:O-antigen ligase